MGETEDKGGETSKDLEYLSRPPGPSRPDADSETSEPVIAPGEALQLVKYSRRGPTLMISGLTPHGRRLTFEQREDREGWYVVAAGRRRRPTNRELALVIASISREIESAGAADGDDEVRSAYRLAEASEQPGVRVPGLQAYRDLLLDEASAYIAGQTKRLGVVAIEYQAFKRFALRHGHRVGQAFVRALGERLHLLFDAMEGIRVCHKAGKSFRMIVADRTSAEIQELVDRITTDETRAWLVARAWGEDPRTHPDEVNFYVGVAMARPSERKSEDYASLAQRLNDDAYRAAKLGQMSGHTSIQSAKTDYRTTVYRWVASSEDEIEALATDMDDGPAEVVAETVDYLNELVPADLEGMAVEGDVSALIHRAIARDGFWQGSTAMRIAADALIASFIDGRDIDEGLNSFVGGFDVGDEFYGVAIEDDALYFCWGDVNSAGATRVRSGLQRVRDAVGWRRQDGGGVVGRFLRAIRPDASTEAGLITRVRGAAASSFEETWREPGLHVNDAVDIADYLWTTEGEPIGSHHLYEGSKLRLSLPERDLAVVVVERRSNFLVRLEIDGSEHVAAVNESRGGVDVKLRIRDTVVSAAICILRMTRSELLEVLAIVREDNELQDDDPLNVVGFLRHIADLLLAQGVKAPGKIMMALGESYDPERFVKSYTLEDARERYPGLFYEAVHQELLMEVVPGLDRNLVELVAKTMLRRPRPESRD